MCISTEPFPLFVCLCCMSVAFLQCTGARSLVMSFVRFYSFISCERVICNTHPQEFIRKWTFCYFCSLLSFYYYFLKRWFFALDWKYHHKHYFFSSILFVTLWECWLNPHLWNYDFREIFSPRIRLFEICQSMESHAHHVWVKNSK